MILVSIEEVVGLLKSYVAIEKSFRRPPGCRIHIALEGLEWYMYNRTAAYENVLSQLGATEQGINGSRMKSRESHVQSEQMRNPQGALYCKCCVLSDIRHFQLQPKHLDAEHSRQSVFLHSSTDSMLGYNDNCQIWIRRVYSRLALKSRRVQ